MNLLSTVLEIGKPKTTFLSEPAPGEGHALKDGGFLPAPHMAEGVNKPPQASSHPRVLCPHDLTYQRPPPNIVTVGIRVSTYEF